MEVRRAVQCGFQDGNRYTTILFSQSFYRVHEFHGLSQRAHNLSALVSTQPCDELVESAFISRLCKGGYIALVNPDTVELPVGDTAQPLSDLLQVLKYLLVGYPVHIAYSRTRNLEDYH